MDSNQLPIEAKIKWEKFAWRNQSESEMLQTIGGLIEVIDQQQKEIERLKPYPHQYKRLSELVDSYEQVLKEIASWTRNPNEYQPSYYSINYLVQSALKGDE